MKHYITKYEENGRQYAEAWLQINLFGKCFCFSRKRIELPQYCDSSEKLTASPICDRALE